MHEPAEWAWARRPGTTTWHLIPVDDDSPAAPRPPCGASGLARVASADRQAMLAGNAELCRLCVYAARRTEMSLARAPGRRLPASVR